MKKILLAPGFMGFGNNQIDFSINYFKELKAMLTAEGFEVFASSASSPHTKHRPM